MRKSRKELKEERRITVERFHRLKDREEDYATARAAATDPTERRRLAEELSRYRRRHREGDIARGKRLPGTNVAMRRNMWALWLDVASDHEQRAADAYSRIEAGETAALGDELRDSLVAVTASAFAVEAVFEDVRYLVPNSASTGKNLRVDEVISNRLIGAFGLSSAKETELRGELEWLFERRNEVVHPYSEHGPPERHPSGDMTGAHSSRFNAEESRHALMVVLLVLRYAENPRVSAHRWVGRWSRGNRDYFEQGVAAVRARVADAG
jgi:hypothetical protein